MRRIEKVRRVFLVNHLMEHKLLNCMTVNITWIEFEQRKNQTKICVEVYVGVWVICVCREGWGVPKYVGKKNLSPLLMAFPKQFNDCLLMTFSMNKIVKLRGEMQVLWQEICCVMLKHNNALKIMKIIRKVFIYRNEKVLRIEFKNFHEKTRQHTRKPNKIDKLNL